MIRYFSRSVHHLSATSFVLPTVIIVLTLNICFHPTTSTSHPGFVLSILLRGIQVQTIFPPWSQASIDSGHTTVADENETYSEKKKAGKLKGEKENMKILFF